MSGRRGRPWKHVFLQVEVAIFPEIDVTSLDLQSRDAAHDSDFGMTEGNFREAKQLGDHLRRRGGSTRHSAFESSPCQHAKCLPRRALLAAVFFCRCCLPVGEASARQGRQSACTHTQQRALDRPCACPCSGSASSYVEKHASKGQEAKLLYYHASACYGCDSLAALSCDCGPVP